MLEPSGAGTLVHHVTIGVREKGLPTYTLVHASEVKGSLRCELEVLSVDYVALNSSAQALGWPKQAHECLIHLKTGRTHQVRQPCAACLSFCCWIISIFKRFPQGVSGHLAG